MLMNRLVPALICTLLATAGNAAPPTEAVVQGLYEGELKQDAGAQKLEARVVAFGKGAYKMFIRLSAEADKVAKTELDGKVDEETIRFSGTTNDIAWTATYTGGAIEGSHGDKAKFLLKRIERLSPALGRKPPERATLLLDGKTFDNMTKGKTRDGNEQEWKVVEGDAVQVPKGGMRSKPQFDGDFDLHVEFKCPLRPDARGQGRGNSGVYLPNGSEIQVLDSFGMTTYKGGGCGGLYPYKDPDAFDEFSLASAPPLQWQSFDVEYRVERKDGKPTGKPRVTVFHNGIKIHDNVTLDRPAKTGTLFFQDHGNPVLYRNVWIAPVEADTPKATND